jgi:hypothetical protein
VFLKLDIVEEGGGLVAILFVAGLGNHYTHCQGIDNLQASPPRRDTYRQHHAQSQAGYR